MTEEKFGELTRKHDETVARLQIQESKERRNRWTVLISLLGALGAGGGGGMAYLQDMGDDDSVKTVVATHVATYDQWRGGADEDIRQIMLEQKNLRDAIIRLQVTVEILSDKHRGGSQLRAGLAEIEHILEQVGKTKHDGRKHGADSKTVQRYKNDLFPSD